MHKELYLYSDGVPHKAIIRNYKVEDFQALIQVQQLSFPPPFPVELLWNEEQLLEHVNRFPEGALCVELDGRIIGSMTGLIVNLADYGHAHDWETITDNGYIRNHNADGDTLYVVDICVVPEYRKSGVAKWLMQSMYETVVHLGLDRLIGGGRMPGYSNYAHKITPEEYLEKVLQGTYNDPVISFLLRCGRVPVHVAHDYLEDEQSHNNAVIMEWLNPFKQRG